MYYHKLRIQSNAAYIVSKFAVGIKTYNQEVLLPMEDYYSWGVNKHM